MKQISKVVGYVLAGGLLLVVLGTIPASAVPCHVPSSAYPTIQAAVNDVTTCVTINVAAGTYSEHVLIDHDVTIRGAGQESTIVDGGGSGTVFGITGGTATVTIANVTIQNGFGGLGGGIHNEATLTVQNSTLSGNRTFDNPFIQTKFGGGIFNLGTLTVQNSIISDNRAFDEGGGIFNAGRGTLTVQNSTLSGNSADIAGGGILNTGTLTIQNSTIFDNRASRGDGGGIINGDTLTVQNSIISDNRAGTNGGGIFNGGTATLTVQNSTISDNRAGTDGGGISNTSVSTVTLTHVTFQNNTPNDCTGCP